MNSQFVGDTAASTPTATSRTPVFVFPLWLEGPVCGMSSKNRCQQLRTTSYKESVKAICSGRHRLLPLTASHAPATDRFISDMILVISAFFFASWVLSKLVNRWNRQAPLRKIAGPPSPSLLTGQSDISLNSILVVYRLRRSYGPGI